VSALLLVWNIDRYSFKAGVHIASHNALGRGCIIKKVITTVLEVSLYPLRYTYGNFDHIFVNAHPKKTFFEIKKTKIAAALERRNRRDKLFLLRQDASLVTRRLFLQRDDRKSSGQPVRVEERVESLPGVNFIKLFFPSVTNGYGKQAGF
jgi:hypothetical protein